MAKNSIMLIEDEAAIRFAIRNFLKAKGFEIYEAETCQQARELFYQNKPDIAILDYKLPDGNALELLPALKEIDSEAPILLLTAHGSIDLAVRAIKEGAEQFLTKPVELPALLVILQRLLDNRRMRQKQLVDKSPATHKKIEPFLGKNSAIKKLEERARKLLSADSPLLIQGETGTGKSVLARWLHDQGSRAKEPFVNLNCASLSREFLETELFGHQKGAFTGAINNKIGLLEVGNRGTVFLDEIGDMDLQVQAKVLKVVEEKQFRRMGDVRDRSIDIRLIAASNQELSQLVQEKKFRSDLYYRINTIVLTIPPLRERSEDIPEIAEYMLKSIAGNLGYGEVKFSSEAIRTLQTYNWPGNIRELRNILERALLLSEGNTLSSKDLNLNIETKTEAIIIKDSAIINENNLNLKEVERQCIITALTQEDWNIDRAARKLGIPKSSLYYKLKSHRIDMRP